MAKEADLKKIELKVSVNCCDGCKRKVKKVLQSVEGVLKTEIDPLHPKVTVLGNVNPQILIKRLLKTGKQAELWSSGNQNARKEKKETDMLVVIEKDEPKSECEQTKSSDSCGKTTDKNKETKKAGDGGESKASKDYNETDISVKACNPEVVKKENSVPPLPEMSNLRTYNQYCYKVEPYAIALPCYAIPSFTVPPPVNSAGYGQEYLFYERPVFQPPFQTPTVRAGDYFSDENTVGCNVM